MKLKVSRSEAYDFSLFEEKVKVKEKSVEDNLVNIEIKEVKANRPVGLSTILLSLAAVSLVVLTVQGQVQLTELTEQSGKLKKELSDSQSAYTQMLIKDKAEMSLKNVEEKALELGMEKADTRQVEYVKVPMSNKAKVMQR